MWNSRAFYMGFLPVGFTNSDQPAGNRDHTAVATVFPRETALEVQFFFEYAEAAEVRTEFRRPRCPPFWAVYDFEFVVYSEVQPKSQLGERDALLNYVEGGV